MFWPEYLKRRGDVNAILMLDNCCAHKIDDKHVPKNLNICFIRLNVKNRHQPAHMGMIDGTKVGCKSNYLCLSMKIFYAPGSYGNTTEESKK